MIILKDYTKLVDYIKGITTKECLSVKSTDNEKWITFYILENDKINIRIFDHVDGYELDYTFLNKFELIKNYDNCVNTIQQAWDKYNRLVEL